ncbi:MAG: glycoside hydrolase family 10 protein [Coleofasciculaceae cyanobacterium]
MNRKLRTWCIYLLCLGLTLVLLRSPPQVAASPPIPPVPTELRGVWLTNVASGVLFVPGGVNRAMHQLAQLKFNTVYPVVWNRGHTYYPSSVAENVMGHSEEPLLWVMRLGGDVLAEIVKQGQKRKLRVVPWFEYGFMTPKGSALARRHPDWLTNKRDSAKTLEEIPEELDLLNSDKQNAPPLSQRLKQFIRQRLVRNTVWLNPLHPDVQKFILDLIVEVVKKYDVAGIQLDDHFGMPVELGYDSFTVQLYQKEHGGKRPPNDPLNAEWMRWRANKITNFVQRINKAVKAVKPKAMVSLSPNSQRFAYRAYLQDWQTWVERGLVDELVVQVYRGDSNSFLAELSQPALQTARDRIPVGIGILSGLWRRPVTMEQIQKQVQSVRDRGFKGVSFFYWESLWGYLAPESPQKRRAAFRKLFSPSTPQKLNLKTGNLSNSKKTNEN